MLKRRRVLIPGGIVLLVVVVALLLSWILGAFGGSGPASLTAAQIQLSKASSPP